MKSIGEFLKTTALGGFFILLPFLLLVLMLDEVVGLVIALATPVAELVFPQRLLKVVNSPLLFALLVLLVMSFALGVIARSSRARRFGAWLQARTLDRVPLYRVLKGLGARLGEIEKGTLFRPTMLLCADGSREFAYLIEEHADGQATILLPRAPTPLSGRVKIVMRAQLQPLDASLGDLTRVLSHWGAGAEALLKSERKA
jgi:uncharacterized membrane protein